MTGQSIGVIIMGTFCYGYLIVILIRGKMSYHVRKERPGKVFVGAFDNKVVTIYRRTEPIKFWVYWFLGLIVSTVMVGVIYIS